MALQNTGWLPTPEIRDTANFAVNGCKCLVYGGAGVGKTRLMRTAPSPLVLSAESGILSLRKEHMPYISIATYADLEASYQHIAFNPQFAQFLTIGIDSASEIAETILADEMTKNKDPRKAYGEMATRMMNLLRQFRDLPGRNVVFTAKMGRLTDQTTGGIMWGPMMPGQQLDQQVPYMFDEVFHLGLHRGQDGVNYPWLRTQADNQYTAKDRSGALQPWEAPDLTAIFQKIAA